jgi:NAD(P)-dependent dehydrogenase (short-subunit alcohol dehydrogenase family)
MTGAAGGMAGAALIVGGGAILRAAALRLARRKLAIAAWDANPDDRRALELDLRREGYAAFDLSEAESEEGSPDRLAEAIGMRIGRVDVLVMGLIGEARHQGELSRGWTEAAHVIERRLGLVRAMAPHLGAAQGARIVNLVSSAGRYRSAYFRADDRSDLVDAAAGGAILALTRQQAFELAPSRIRVNAVVVGLIEGETAEPTWSALSETERAFVIEEISLGRIGTPDEAAAVIEFLAVAGSSYLTGTAIDVNGGWWMS